MSPNMGFVVPLALLLGSASLDLAICRIWVQQQQEILVMDIIIVAIATCLRLVLVTISAALFYSGR